MESASRRAFVKTCAISGLGAWLAGRSAGATDATGDVATNVGTAREQSTAAGDERSTRQRPTVPLIHVTDLFHPHGDPDDHFDLACVYALALRKRFDLRGIVIDYPPSFRAGDPAVVAVAQMNRASGLTVPVAIGTSRKLASRTDDLADSPLSETAAIRFIIDQMRTSHVPIALTCVGAATDIVVAALREPDLFRDKCAGVYLNSGSAHNNPDRPAQFEFNVRLDPAAYAAMFDLPCPLYWFPCWNITEMRQSGASGSFYWLPHREALAGISHSAANFFAYMFDKATEPKWLRAMTDPPPRERWEQILAAQRGMWSTASLLAAAGLTVTREGDIRPADEADDAAVFRLVRIEATCADNGETNWRPAEPFTASDSSRPRAVREMLAVTDVASYPGAMTRAVNTLLKTFE